MKALIVYESYWGNTELVARAIGRGIRDAVVDVIVLDVSDAGEPGADVTLIVAGGPTHVMSMTRPRTRTDAVRQGGSQGDPVHGLREWLQALPALDETPPVFTFDTRLRVMRHLPGSAARSAATAARRKGYPTPLAPQSFYVANVPGPLVDGELERAYAWGRRLAAAALPEVRPV